MEKKSLIFHPNLKYIIEDLTDKKFNEDGIIETSNAKIYLSKPVEEIIEVIVASAININGAIIVGKRHSDCIKSAIESGIAEAPIRAAGQGFYTSNFRFITREFAKILALRNGQIKKDTHSEILFSEDLR